MGLTALLSLLTGLATITTVTPRTTSYFNTFTSVPFNHMVPFNHGPFIRMVPLNPVPYNHMASSNPFPHQVYNLHSPPVPYFNVELSKPLQKEDVGAVVLDEQDIDDIADVVDLVEFDPDEELNCEEEGTFLHPVYCDKFYTCTEQDGVLKSEEFSCDPGELYNPLLLQCEKAEGNTRIWISSSLEVTCTTTSQDSSTTNLCKVSGLTAVERDLCEKQHWRHTDGFKKFLK